MKARVRSYSARRGTAVVIDEHGRRIYLPWEVLRGVPIFAPGMVVEVVTWPNGAPREVKVLAE